MRPHRFSKMSLNAVMLLVLSVTSIQASVIYNFVGTGFNSHSPNEPVAFQLTAPTFISPPFNGTPVGFSCGQLDSSTNCLNTAGIQVQFARDNPGTVLSDTIGFLAADGSDYSFFFKINAFAATGVYLAPEAGIGGNGGTLTVTQTPEPTTLLLCLGGFCFYRFRRFANKRSMAVAV